MIMERLPELKRLSPSEKLRLAAELWGEIEDRQQDITIDEAMFHLLETRFSHYEKNPATAVAWEDFKRHIGK